MGADEADDGMGRFRRGTPGSGAARSRRQSRASRPDDRKQPVIPKHLQRIRLAWCTQQTLVSPLTAARCRERRSLPRNKCGGMVSLYVAEWYRRNRRNGIV